MDETARSMIFVGMSELYKGYILYDPATGGFETAIHCVFRRDQYPLRADTVGPVDPPMPPVLPLPPVHRQELIEFVRPPPVPEPEGWDADVQRPASPSSPQAEPDVSSDGPPPTPPTPEMVGARGRSGVVPQRRAVRSLLQRRELAMAAGGAPRQAEEPGQALQPPLLPAPTPPQPPPWRAEVAMGMR